MTNPPQPLEALIKDNDWWGCDIPDVTGTKRFCVYGHPEMTEADALSWCENIGGENLHKGEYTVSGGLKTDIEAQNLVDVLNKKVKVN